MSKNDHASHLAKKASFQAGWSEGDHVKAGGERKFQKLTLWKIELKAAHQKAVGIDRTGLSGNMVE